MKLAHAATEDRRLLLCDPKAGTLLTQVAAASILPGAGAGLAGLAFSPDGQQLAVGSGDGIVVYPRGEHLAGRCGNPSAFTAAR